MNRHACRRCDWTPATHADSPGPLSQLADHAADSGHPCCVCCGTSLPTEQPQTCLPCIAAVRRRLAGVVELYALLPDDLARLASGSDWRDRGPRSNDVRVPGGDILVLLSPGSAGVFWAAALPPSMPDGERTPDANHPWQGVGPPRPVNDNLLTDAPSVAYELSRWEDDWRAVRGEAAATSAANVVTAVSYLTARLTWAADQHPAFGDFATDVRSLHARLESATGRADRPETGAPCMDCGAFLERGWTDAGLADEWRCPRCHRVYEDAAYWLAVRAGLERERERREGA